MDKRKNLKVKNSLNGTVVIVSIQGFLQFLHRTTEVPYKEPNKEPNKELDQLLIFRDDVLQVYSQCNITIIMFLM